MVTRLQSGGATGNDEGAHALFTRRFIGPAENDVSVGDGAVGDEGFRPVEDILLFSGNGCGGNGHHVRAGARLGQGERAQVWPAGEGNQVGLFLLFRSEELQCHADDTGMK